MNELPRRYPPEQHVRCPECIAREGAPDGWIFQDARGGFECTVCDARFVFYRDPPHGYGGPRGPLSWLELHAIWFDRVGWLAIGGALVARGWLGLVLLAAACWLLALSRGVRR